MTTPPRVEVETHNLAGLPSVVFGRRQVIWWGTLGFMVVEGVTLSATLATWFYVRQNFQEWPPPGTPMPDLTLGTLGLLSLLAGFIPYRILDRAAKRLDRGAVRRWLWGGTAASLIATIIRFLEFSALDAPFDLNAYASAVWAILVTHLTLLVADVFETGTAAVIFTLGRDEPKHFPDASDNSAYWYFLALSWVPCYAVIYLLPRVM
jgi:heme/copper-type cytochrome/quinol oxidase subunit 3